MCGIAGIIGKGDTEAVARRMTASLAHRGPDDRGLWVDAEAGVALGHRRLSIVDLSPAGREPMHSASGRFVVTFNGEIYNHARIRSDLERRGLVPEGGWRGHSDIETLLQAIECFGLAKALESAVGMFAFGLWDRAQRTLTLVRDRFGEKPLYYGWVGSDFLFASELKAFRAHPRFANPVDRAALRLLAGRSCIPAPLSIHERIFKLIPGCVLTVPLEKAGMSLDHPPQETSAEGLRLERYWSYRDVVRAGLANPVESENEALSELDRVLSSTISDQSVADVPVGMFLSGGIDSSTVAAFYQRTSSRPVRTFSIGFEDSSYNESPFARLVADRLGTVHHEQIVTERDALDTIPLLPTIYDEPFADSSQIPTYLVSRMARQAVTVVLTGDGGDELFGGYRRHFQAPRFWRVISRVPVSMRQVAAAPLWRIPTAFLRTSASLKVQKALRVATRARRIGDLYGSLLDEWCFEASPVLNDGGTANEWDLEVASDAPDEVRIMYCDAVSYLPDDILCKVDRAAMAVSLETRVPFLDHRVAEVAARIPVRFKVGGGQGKAILRRLLYRELPKELFERPKAGFAIPLGAWLAGPLRSWAESLLDARRLKGEGWFDPAAVRRRWDDHLSGRRDAAAAIWAVLMFQAWLDNQRSRTELPA